MSHPNPFAPATRVASQLRIGVAGPSGSGKTLGAHAQARAIAGPHGRITVIDTEHSSAALYADQYQFDTLSIRPPYLTSKFIEAINAAVANKYQVVVIDSISHQWDGEGGILQRKEETDARGGNHFSNWAPFTKEHNGFRSALLTCGAHLIVTMRSKQAYQMSEGDSKKSSVKKLGMAPIQREGMEYELTVTFDLQMDHLAAASKDRTGLFADKLTDLIKPVAGAQLMEWLSTAKAVVTGEQRERFEALLLKECWTDAQRDAMRRAADDITTEDGMDEFLERGTAKATELERARKTAGAGV